MSYAEYRESEATSAIKSEYLRGEVFAMAPREKLLQHAVPFESSTVLV